LLKGLEPFLGGRVPTDVQLELIEGGSQELDLDAGRGLAGLADPSEEARADEAGEDAEDDDHDQELDQREPGLAASGRTECRRAGRGARTAGTRRCRHR
jgi:hypothetical protein